MLLSIHTFIILVLELLIRPAYPLSIVPESTSLYNVAASRLVCYEGRSLAPRISTPADCGIAVRKLIADYRRAADPTAWGPGIEKYRVWAWGSCVLMLKPNAIQSSDTFSPLRIAEEASRLVAGCVNPAHWYKGGYTTIGPKGVFTVAVMGGHRSKAVGGIEEDRKT